MNTSASRTTAAYVLQSVLSFGIALAVVIIGEVNLPVAGWTRAFLGLGTVFLVSATFTLAKCIRDQHENETVVSRLDQARIERLLAEYDPFRMPDLGGAQTHAAQAPAHQPQPQPHSNFQPVPNFLPAS